MAARKKKKQKTGGRKKGTPNRATAARERAIAASGLTPLDYMLTVLRNPRAKPALRFEAARTAAPYVHPKLAAIEHTGKDGGPIETHETGALSELELARRIAFALEQAAQKKD